MSALDSSACPTDGLRAFWNTNGTISDGIPAATCSDAHGAAAYRHSESAAAYGHSRANRHDCAQAHGAAHSRTHGDADAAKA